MSNELMECLSASKLEVSSRLLRLAKVMKSAEISEKLREKLDRIRDDLGDLYSDLGEEIRKQSE